MAKYIKSEDGYRTAQDIGLATTEMVQETQETVDSKMDAANPVGTGSFSMNRLNGSAVGHYSHAEGAYTEASGDYSHAEGYLTAASGHYSHAEGACTEASGDYSHAEGVYTEASGDYSHAEGAYTEASGDYSHAEGAYTEASGHHSHAEGYFAAACSRAQHAQGEWNILDTEGNIYTRGKYAHIVGNGTLDTKRSNAHTLDWNGVGWYQGGLQVGGKAQDNGAKNVLLEGDAIPVPASASVGQLLVVKSIDDSGKPTEWEAMTLATETWTFQMADGSVVTKEVYVKS